MKNKVTNLYEVKKARILTKELSNVIIILNETIQSLKPYEKYTPVVDSIRTLKSSKMMLEIHLNKYKEVLENA